MSDLYTKASKLQRSEQALNLMEWGVMLLKAGLVAQVLGMILIIINKFAYGFLLWGINLILMLVAHGLKKRAIHIYPEGFDYE